MPIRMGDANILVVAFADELLPRNVDPVEEALEKVFALKGSARPYTRGVAPYLLELRAHDLFLEDRDRFWRLRPRLRLSSGEFAAGRFHSFQIGTKKVNIFLSDLRLNTDGPTVPVFRLMNQLLEEATPELVVHVGLAGGVRADHQGGDVIIANRAKLLLRGELAGVPENGRTFATTWTPAPNLFAELELEDLQEPPLIAPSPQYPADCPRPVPHTPIVRVEPLPVATRPRITDTSYDLASPDKEDSDHRGDEACAIDMDAAAVAAACDERNIPCALVLGLSSPAVRPHPNDYENTLRRAWSEHLITHFASAAAMNAAKVAERIVRGAV